MFLETERLILRKFQEKDFADFCGYAIDDEMSRMMGRRLLKTEEDAQWNFDWLKDKEERCYGLVYRETGRIIGNITICDVPTELLELEQLKGKSGKSLSFSISKDYQRKGLMLEVLNTVIKHLFDIENIDYIQCSHVSFNTASESLQKKLGFEYLKTQYYDSDGIKVISIANILWKNNCAVAKPTVFRSADIVYNRENIMDIIYLPHWVNLNKEEMILSIEWIREKLIILFGVEEYVKKISYTPKDGYEDAFANYNKDNKSIFINPKYIENNSLFCIWNLIHELQHAVQERNKKFVEKGELKSNYLYNSLKYYFMYDGTSYRFGEDQEFICKIKGSKEFCLELYLRNPMEEDANRKAYSELKNLIKTNFHKFGQDNESLIDLENIKNMMLPDFKIIKDDIVNYVIEECQSLVELEYQYHIDSINEENYKIKKDNIYRTVDILLNKRKV